VKGRRAGARRGVLVHGPEPAPLDAQDGDQLVQAEPLAQEQPVVRVRAPLRSPPCLLDAPVLASAERPRSNLCITVLRMHRPHAQHRSCTLATPCPAGRARSKRLPRAASTSLAARPRQRARRPPGAALTRPRARRIAINREHAHIAALDKALENVFVNWCYVTYEDG
jgi:hypothetical protein